MPRVATTKKSKKEEEPVDELQEEVPVKETKKRGGRKAKDPEPQVLAKETKKRGGRKAKEPEPEEQDEEQDEDQDQDQDDDENDGDGDDSENGQDDEQDEEDEQDQEDEEVDEEEKPVKKGKGGKASAKASTKSSSNRSSDRSDNRAGNRVKVVRISVPTADEQTEFDQSGGKTYRRDAKDGTMDGQTGSGNRGNQTSVLRFSYDDALQEYGAQLLNECDTENILKYLIASTHQTGQRAVCNVLKNTLTGLKGETNLPLSTLGNQSHRHSQGQGRRGGSNHRSDQRSNQHSDQRSNQRSDQRSNQRSDQRSDQHFGNHRRRDQSNNSFQRADTHTQVAFGTYTEE